MGTQKSEAHLLYLYMLLFITDALVPFQDGMVRPATRMSMNVKVEDFARKVTVPTLPVVFIALVLRLFTV